MDSPRDSWTLEGSARRTLPTLAVALLLVLAAGCIGDASTLEVAAAPGDAPGSGEASQVLFDETVPFVATGWFDVTRDARLWLDPVPQDAMMVSVLLRWDAVERCPPAAATCYPFVLQGRSREDMAYADHVAGGEGYVLYLYGVDEDVPADDADATKGSTFLQPGITTCTDDPAPEACDMGALPTLVSAEVRVLAEAWARGVTADEVLAGDGPSR